MLKKRTKIITLRLDEYIYELLQKEAIRNNETISHIIRTMIFTMCYQMKLH